MKKLKVLNLYAGIGGNRKEWEYVEVTAVENKPEIAAIYQELYPDDTVIVGDAHAFLLEHYKGFDLSKYKGIDKRLALRNCVHPKMGRHILSCARNIITKQNVNQVDMFND